MSKVTVLIKNKKGTSSIYAVFSSLFKVALVVLICSFSIAFMTNLSAQEEKSEKEEKQLATSTSADGTILEQADIFQYDASKMMRSHVKRTKKNIRYLYVLVQNYGDKVSESQKQYESVKNTYAEALQRFYAQQYTFSLKLHYDNEVKIKALYASFAKNYREQVRQLIFEGSRKLVDSEVEQGNNRHKKIPYIELKNLRNSLRMKRAYKEQAAAHRMEDSNLPKEAIDHYRLAKIYAIQAMRSLEQDPARRKELASKYRKDLIDSRGLVSGQ